MPMTELKMTTHDETVEIVEDNFQDSNGSGIPGWKLLPDPVNVLVHFEVHYGIHC